MYLSLTLEKPFYITMHLYMTSTTFIFFSGFYGLLEKIHHIIPLNSLSSCSTITDTSMIKFTTTSNTSYYLRCLEKGRLRFVEKNFNPSYKRFINNYYYEKL